MVVIFQMLDAIEDRFGVGDGAVVIGVVYGYIVLLEPFTFICPIVRRGGGGSRTR